LNFPKAKFKRARQDAQKAVRRAQILHEAKRQIEERDYSAVSIAHIAQQLGIAKGTVFVYFPTKESLFLTVAEMQFQAWFSLVSKKLVSISKKADLVEALLSSIESLPLMPKMVSLLHPVLEHNVQPSQILAFKIFLKEGVMDLGAQVDKRLSWHTGAGAQSLFSFHTLLIGAYQMANPSPAVALALENDDLAFFRLSLRPQLEYLLPLVCRNRQA